MAVPPSVIPVRPEELLPPRRNPVAKTGIVFLLIANAIALISLVATFLVLANVLSGQRSAVMGYMFSLLIWGLSTPLAAVGLILGIVGASLSHRNKRMAKANLCIAFPTYALQTAMVWGMPFWGS